MEGSPSSTPAGKGNSSSKVIAIVAVAILLMATVGAALFLVSIGNSGKNDTADNWLDKGFNMEIFYDSASTARGIECQLIKSGLESLNPGKIHVTVTALEWSSYVDYYYGGKMPAMFLSWLPDYPDPDNYVPAFYQSDSYYPSVIHYSNSTIDALIAQAAAELNSEARAALYKEISWAEYNESAYILTAQFANFDSMRDYVENLVHNTMYNGLYFYPIVKNTAVDADVLKIGRAAGDPSNFDPASDYESVGGEVFQNCYETLFFYDRNSTSTDIIPQLASCMPTEANGGISADGLTYNITLRDDVKFFDGNLMTAADVVYSFERAAMLNDPSGVFRTYGVPLFGSDTYNNYGAGAYDITTNSFTPGISKADIDAHVWAPDATHVVFNLSTPYTPFLQSLAFWGSSVVEKAYVEAYGGLTAAGYEHMANNIMGTGPFHLKEFVSQDHMILERNDYYWQGPASLKTLYFSYSEDVNTRILALKNAEDDIANIPVPQKESVNVTGVKFQVTPSYSMEFMGMNQKINVTDADPAKTNVPSDFFADINVRLAFAYAFDYVAFEKSQQPTVIIPNSAIPKGMFGYSDEVPHYSHDLELAKQYLKAAKVHAPVSSNAGLSVFSDAMVALVRLED
jgi:ABC-type transport system substrate-binding protein